MTSTGKSISLPVSSLHTVDKVKVLYAHVQGVPPDQLRLIYAGGQLQDGRTLEDHKVRESAVVHLAYRLRGGGWMQPTMRLAAGGLIKQSIAKDRFDPESWDLEACTVLSVQMLMAIPCYLRQSPAFRRQKPP